MKNKTLIVVSTLLGLMMLTMGFNKFAHFMPMPDAPGEGGSLMSSFADSGWLLQLIATAEMIGGALLIFPKTRALGAIVLFPVIAGIFMFHLTMEPSGLLRGSLVLAINLWIIFENREKYKPMIA